MKKKLFTSLEEDLEDGHFNKEVEHVYYARITDFKQLEKAESRVRQEQWEINVPLVAGNAAKGSVRVRKIVAVGDAPRYVLTSKLSLAEDGSKMEVSSESTMEQFVQFKLLAQKGMVKDRFTFPTEGGLKWEVDVFIDPTGGYFQWCKIDFEVPNLQTQVPAFPIQIYDQVEGTFLQRGSAEDKKIQGLYDQYFLSPNQYKKSANTKLDKQLDKEFPNKVQDEVLLD